jgi:hypothetical protein
MINVQRIETSLRIIYASAKLENERPLSAVIIAPSDAGKSQLIMRARPAWGKVMNDFTYMTLIENLSELYDSGKGPKHTTLIVPDFNAVIGHRASVSTLTSSVLLALLAEGLSEIPGIDGQTKLRVQMLKDCGITASLITGVTPEMFASKRGKWRQTGLLRRLLPVNYTYRPQSVSLISRSIEKGKDRIDYSPDYYKYPSKTATVTIPDDIAKDINLISERSLGNLCWRHANKDGRYVSVRAQELPFSLHKCFRVFCKSSAWMHGEKQVKPRDVEQLEDFSSFVRYDRPEEI